MLGPASGALFGYFGHLFPGSPRNSAVSALAGRGLAYNLLRPTTKQAGSTIQPLGLCNDI